MNNQHRIIMQYRVEFVNGSEPIDQEATVSYFNFIKGALESKVPFGNYSKFIKKVTPLCSCCGQILVEQPLDFCSKCQDHFMDDSDNPIFMPVPQQAYDFNDLHPKRPGF